MIPSARLCPATSATLAWHHDERAAVAVLEALADDAAVRDVVDESLRVLRSE